MRPREHRIVVGMSGSGKSILTHSMLFDFDRVIVVDRKGEYTEGPLFYDFEHLCDYVENRDRFIAVWRGGNKCAHLSEVEAFERQHGRPWRGPRCAGNVDHLCHLARAVGDCVVVLEEATVYDVPADSEIEECCLRTGRERGVHFIVTSQKPHLVHPTLRSEATSITSFCMKEPSELQWLRGVFGDRAHELSTMPRWHGLAWDWSAPEKVTSIDVTP